jgi:DNA-binding response OmpR family regulator
VFAASDGEQALARFREQTPDVVLLDVTMPKQDGFGLLREIRRVSDVPVLMLTARSGEIDQVRGLGLGADAYLSKPFSHLALMARIKAVLRRAELPPVNAKPDFVAGDLAINYQAHQVTVRGEPVKLTPMEYELLCHLARNAGRVMPHTAILEHVWGRDDEPHRDSVKVYVSRLRAKLGPDPAGPWDIETERGLGYRFVRR